MDVEAASTSPFANRVRHLPSGMIEYAVKPPKYVALVGVTLANDEYTV
jgi:hypothetical protein